MFVKSDGGETDTIHTARCFLTYDEAVAFCRAKKLAAVELVTQTDDQSVYVTTVPARYLAPADEEETGAFAVQHDAPLIEGKCAPELHEPDLQTDGCGLKAACGECEVELRQEPRAFEPVDESELAICRYVKLEMAEQVLQFHFNPPPHCGVCGVELNSRRFFVDGRVSASGEWRDMCSRCFLANGAKLGPGKGQLFQRQTDGRWLLVGGFGR